MKKFSSNIQFFICNLLIFIGLSFHVNAQTLKTNYQFFFGPGKCPPDYLQVKPNQVYSEESRYGFDFGTSVISVDRGGKNLLESGFCTSAKPFYFSVNLPEGNYEVTVTLGDLKEESVTTVKVESRRLMLMEVKTKKGKIEKRTFTVNVRTPQINANERIKLKPREINYLNWDNKLTFEFNNQRPCLCALEIKKTDNAVTVFLAGNSTVVDQEKEPWAAWGQMIPLFFKKEVSIANYAESGEALSSFKSEKRLDKVLSLIKPGDYLFIEFGHNDQKQKGEGIGAFTSYKKDLQFFISEVKKKNAIPVLVSSIHRRNFDSTGHVINTLGDYPEAVRNAAKEENVALIDLNTMSKTLYEALGPEKSIKAFVHYPANSFPGQTQELKDNTHFSTYGAYEIAKCIVEGIKSNKSGIVKFITDEYKGFDPAHPDEFESFKLPQSPEINFVKPDGN